MNILTLSTRPSDATLPKNLIARRQRYLSLLLSLSTRFCGRDACVRVVTPFKSQVLPIFSQPFTTSNVTSASCDLFLVFHDNLRRYNGLC